MTDTLKNFNDWNTKKKEINSELPRQYHIREIWWCRLGLNIGSEQDGKGDKYLRPVLILKDFGTTCLIVPLTSSEREHVSRIPIGEVQNYPAKAVISQIRVVDSRRLVENIKLLDIPTFDLIRKTVKEIL